MAKKQNKAERPNGGQGATGFPTAEQISKRARELWLERGCIAGSDLRNWLDAERELKSPVHEKTQST
jgi:hypothetical protein